MQQNGSFAHTLQQLGEYYLHRDRVRRRGFFEYEHVAQVLRACRGAYHPETAMRLWTLIVTEIWAEIYLDARGRCPQPGYIGLAQQRHWAPLPNAVPST